LGAVRWTGSEYDVSALDAGAEPGTLLAFEHQPPAELLATAERFRFIYQSENVSGARGPVSAVLLVPPGTPPAGGWPVVSWAHGTTGVADKCAPSATDNLFYNEYAEEARSMMAAGYAVVATDYVGLGTPGMHSYLIGVDGANAVVDAVVAAHQLAAAESSIQLDVEWFASGHSQGGQAALFATRARSRAPGYPLLGAVAIAPASQMRLALPFIMESGAAGAVPYGVYMVAGLETVDESFETTDVLGPLGRSLEDTLLRTGCWPDGLTALQAAEQRGEDLSSVFEIDPRTMSALTEKLERFGDADNEGVEGAVMVVQGETDVDVPKVATDQMVASLVGAGAEVDYRTYADKGHDQVLGPSICDRLRWMAERGGPEVTNCSSYETDMSY
jgi:pimeloyl-ACP methyl ester carboxylesterase